MPSNTIVFTSPKAAGASSVSFNAALLQQIKNRSLKIAWIEFSPYHTQRLVFSPQTVHTWAEFLPFYQTEDWKPEILKKLASSVGVDAFWSPSGYNWPQFELGFAQAWWHMLITHYDLVVFDVNLQTPLAWREFLFQEAEQVVGVVTPDPLGINAWEQWSSSQPELQQKLAWVLNQSSRSEISRLKERFAQSDFPLLGVLRQEPSVFWTQMYQHFPVVFQRRSRFKKDLDIFVSHLFS